MKLSLVFGVFALAVNAVAWWQFAFGGTPEYYRSILALQWVFIGAQWVWVIIDNCWAKDW